MGGGVDNHCCTSTSTKFQVEREPVSGSGSVTYLVLALRGLLSYLT